MTKTIEHYLANPEDLPTDMAEIEALMGGDAGDVPETDSGNKEAKEDVTPAPSGPAESDASEQEPDAETPAPIASKDGKHTIPYAVLATEREKRLAAERMQQELMQRLSDIETKTAQGQNVTNETQEMQELLDGEDTQEMLADFPALKPVVEYTKRLEKQVDEFRERFNKVEQLEMQRLQEQASKAQEDVRREIDANPMLRFWEQQDPERWEAAVTADEQLKQLPINKSLSMRERFEKVVSVVEAIYGATELPAEYAASKPKTVKTTEKVEVAPLKPRTLGEIPGGTAPKADDLEELLEQSAAHIAGKLDRMTPDQISGLLARLG